MLPQIKEQKKILLAAVNASYVHSNPAVYALRRSAYAFAENSSSVFPQIDIAEYTINDRYEDILFCPDQSQEHENHGSQEENSVS